MASVTGKAMPSQCRNKGIRLELVADAEGIITRTE
jgi:hypothetical protein